LTDHGTGSGWLELFHETQKWNKQNPHQPIKPIMGMEAYTVEDRTVKVKGELNKHLLLWARNQEGYKNLLKLHYEGYATGAAFVYDRIVPRIDHRLLSRETCRGIIASTGCLASEFSQFLLKDDWDSAVQLAEKYKKIFDCLFAEVQPPHLIDLQGEINEKILKLAEMCDLPIICTTDSHYLEEKDREAHQLVLAIQSKKDIYDPDRFTFEATHLTSTEEMREYFDDSVIKNTQKLADMCEYPHFLEFDEHGYRLPKYPVPKDEEYEEWGKERLVGEDESYRYCTYLVEKNWNRKLRQTKNDPKLEEKYRDRLKVELETIKEMGFIDYFLIVWDFVDWCRQISIMTGCGRGSAGGSLLSYLLGITKLDPLTYDLLFSRFLNRDRISLPDIDMDIDKARRDEVKEYLAEKYGQDHVASIATFSRMKVRACIKDIVRSLRIGGNKKTSFEIADRINKALKGASDDIKYADAVKDYPEFARYMEEYPDVAHYAQEFEGLIRQTGIHAAGIIIGAEPLTDTIPLMVDKNKVVATAYDGVTLEKDGFLKIDLLGLKNLTIITEACDNIEKIRGKRLPGFYTKGIDVHFDEPEESFEHRLKQASPGKQSASKAYKLLREGKTNGVFQVESGTMRDLLKSSYVNSIEDIAAVLSLCRPGPLKAGMTTEYGNRKRSGEDCPEWYVHDSLKPILKKTYGILCYQEQIMHMAVQCAGFTEPESDTLRKCVRKGTLIQLSSGARVPIEEIKIDDVVCSINCYGNAISKKVLKVYDNGIQKIQRIITNKGQIDVTSSHRLYTPLGWKSLSSLKEDDFIAFPKRVYTEGYIKKERRWQRHHMRLLGYLISDGCTTHSIPRFYNSNKAIREEYGECLAQLMSQSKDTAKSLYQEDIHPGTGCVCVKPNDISRRRLKSFVQQMSLTGKRASEKTIPEEIFKYPNSYLCNLIGALWSGDGCIEQRGVISYSSTSRILIEQILSLLLRFDIRSFYQIKKHEGYNDSYELMITNPGDVFRFLKHFTGYIVGPRQVRAKELLRRSSINSSCAGSGSDILPLEFGQLIQERINQTMFSVSELERMYDYSSNSLNIYTGLRQNRGYNRNRLRRLAYHLQDNVLFSLSTNDLEWVQIKKIVGIGEDKVYDLEIEDTHCFIANNFLVHNCVGKKIHSLMMEQEDKFIEGCQKVTLMSPSIAQKLWEEVKGFAAYGFNKCLSYDTEIATVDGQVLKIGDLVGKDVSNLRLYSINENGELTENQLEEVFSTGENELYEVEFEDGRIVKCTLQHRFMCEDGEFHTVQNILDSDLEVINAQEVVI
jgi:DNA polymerase-3 subunit alpha